MYKKLAIKLGLIFFLLIFLSSYQLEKGALAKKRPLKEKRYVVRVIDGDTFVLKSGAKVRLIGVDTPEINQPYYKKAKDFLRSLIEGKVVFLEKDVSQTDRYGRLLRYVYVGNIFVNAQLVKKGFAQVLTYPPDVKHAHEFIALQKEARAAKRGIWKNKPSSNRLGWQLIGNKNSKKLHNLIHRPCQNYANKTKRSNKVYFRSAKEALSQGFNFCLRCF